MDTADNIDIDTMMDALNNIAQQYWKPYKRVTITLTQYSNNEWESKLLFEGGLDAKESPNS